MTAALPYANSSIHVGHILEYFQADVWTRFQKMRGHECHYLCGNDTHGTPIMVAAQKLKLSPEEHIQNVAQEHIRDFKEFQIDFSFFSSTHIEENRKLCEFFFQKMREKNHIEEKEVEQFYCEHDQMFLPDRYVKGVCPHCKSSDQYGDSCDKCAATYSPLELIQPACSLCGRPPVRKKSLHLFFTLEHFRDFLSSWLEKHTSSEVHNKMKEWFREPLRSWDISREAPYFGFPIPGYPGKFFYVWVDAPMGYVSFFQKFNPESYNDFWLSSERTEVYHFIGKDVVYFHTLFWPALLESAGFRTPSAVFVHGHVMVNGEKMSKSKGTQISVRKYLELLDPAYLRYYYASKLSSHVDDVDLSIDDFTQRVNAELIGKITNLGSRGIQMINKKMNSQLSTLDEEARELVERFQSSAERFAQWYEQREYAKLVQEVRELADLANKYFDEKAPWKTAETDPYSTQKVLTTTVNFFRWIVIYLTPILPVYSDQVATLLNEKNENEKKEKTVNLYTWDDVKVVLENRPVNSYFHLLSRVDKAKANQLVETLKS